MRAFVVAVAMLAVLAAPLCAQWIPPGPPDGPPQGGSAVWQGKPGPEGQPPFAPGPGQPEKHPFGGPGQPGFGGGPMGKPPFGGGPGMGGIPWEKAKEALARVREWDEERANDLEELFRRAPEKAMDVLHRTLREMDEMAELKKRDPALFEKLSRRRKLERQSGELGNRLRKEADAAKKVEAEKELRALLAELFDLRTLELEKRVEDLGRELERARGVLAKKKENRAEVIDRRYRQLTGDESLEW